MITTTQVVEALVGLVLVLLASVWLVHHRRLTWGPRVTEDVRARAATATEEAAFRKILVPTLGTIGTDRMVSLACKMARPDDAEVEVLYVIEVPLSLPATAELPDQTQKAAQALSEAEVIGRGHGIRIRGRVTKARFAGKTIVDVATSEGADLIILAAPGRKRTGEWGRTIEYVFRNAPCDVILDRAGQDRVEQ